MDRLPVRARMVASACALGSVWLLSALGFTIYLRDGRGFSLWLIWSSVFFVAGWILIGLPLIALGERARRFPIVFLLAVGWLGGMVLLLLPTFIVRWMTPEVHYAPLSWKMVSGWPSLGGTLGAGTVALYRLFLSRSVSAQIAQANTTVN